LEQTISVAYPNVALHGYLRETGQLTRETEARLNEAHRTGLQRILSFEAAGGGFGWYGGREGNALLSGYCAMFLADLAKVFEFDPRILERTIAWLEKAQDSRGRWIGSDGHATWQRLSDAEIPCTAYVASAVGASSGTRV